MKSYLAFFFMHFFSVVEGSELQDSSSANLKEEDGPSSSVTLVKKQFAGRYAITSDEFTGELVKLQNYIYLFIFHVEGSVLFVLFLFFFCCFKIVLRTFYC